MNTPFTRPITATSRMRTFPDDLGYPLIILCHASDV